MNESMKQRLRLLWVAGVLAPAAMVIAGLLISRVGTGRWPSLLHIPTWEAVLVGLATAASSMGLIFLLYKSSKRFERALRGSGTRVGEEALRLAGYPVLVVVVTTAALGEEILFRGALQPILGLPVAALLFGFSHGGWRRENWAYVVAAALSGLLFGSVYVLTGDLWTSIIAHVGHNLLSTLFLGKRVQVEWSGIWPVIRLVQDEEPDEEPDGRRDDVPDGAPDGGWDEVPDAEQDAGPKGASVSGGTGIDAAGMGQAGAEQSALGESADPAAGEPASVEWGTSPQEATSDDAMDDSVPSQTDRPDDGPDLGTDPDRSPE